MLTSASIKYGINDWFFANSCYYGIPIVGTAKYVYIIHDQYVRSQVNSNRTCVVALGSILGSPYGNHMVMVYGYDTGSNLYRCHLGYTSAGASDTYINRGWTGGATWIQ